MDKVKLHHWVAVFGIAIALAGFWLAHHCVGHWQKLPGWVCSQEG